MHMKNPSNKVLIIDASSAGISGDMLVASLIDLGAPQKDVLDAMGAALNALNHTEAEIAVDDVRRCGFRCKLLRAKYGEPRRHYRPGEIIKAVETAAKLVTRTKEAAEYAVRAVKTLIEAEAHLHSKQIEDLCLHETGSADTVAEAVGSAVALEHLNLLDADVYVTPVAVGGGLIQFSHGITSAPAPAALHILTAKKIPFHGGPVESELTTPTGASLLASLNPKPTRYYPQIQPLKTGFGAGSKEIEGLPNILRLILGEKMPEGTYDTVTQLETNLDDASGEVVSRACKRLLEEGALDVAILPAFMKKGRPGWIIKALCAPEDATKLSSTLMAEAGTLGVRILTMPRCLAKRRIETKTLNVGGVEYKVTVKVSETPNGRGIRAKPEFSELEKISDETRIPLRQLLEMVEGDSQA